MKDLNYRQEWQIAVKANRILLILLVGAIVMAIGLGVACNIAKSAINVSAPPITTKVVDEPTAAAESTAELTAEPTPESPKATLNDYRSMVNMIDAQYIAKAIAGEAGIVKSKTRQAAVAWAILNRVDRKIRGTTILEVVTAPAQIQGYWTYADKEVDEYYISLAVDVLARWTAEKAGECPEFVGRVLPSDYIYWYGDGHENYFTSVYHDGSLDKAKSHAWNWILSSPYAN